MEIFIFIFGLCLGSFANVLIDRTERGESLWGYSKCDFCGHRLRWYENIPVLSFLFLKAKCGKCGKKLSWQYPLVELLSGLFLLLTFILYQRFGFQHSLFPLIDIGYVLTVSYIFLVIAVWDIKYMIIPNSLLIAGVAITAAYFVFPLVIDGGVSGKSLLLEQAGGAVVLAVFFGTMYWFSKGKWIGGGDVKLGFLLGLIVGLKMIYLLILIAYISGSVLAIYLLLLKKKKMRSEIPFGPFLLLAGYIILFFGEIIWNDFILGF